MTTSMDNRFKTHRAWVWFDVSLLYKNSFDSLVSLLIERHINSDANLTLRSICIPKHYFIGFNHFFDYEYRV